MNVEALKRLKENGNKLARLLLKEDYSEIYNFLNTWSGIYAVRVFAEAAKLVPSSAQEFLDAFPLKVE